MRRKEAGNVFDSGSRAPIAITILVKNPEHIGDAEIFYLDIGDYLSREEKLSRIKNLRTVLSDEFKIITPNSKGDWINQRGNEFENYIPLAPERKFDTISQSFFVINSMGITTNRDAWIYNFSRRTLADNMQKTIEYYSTHESTDVDSTKIIWTRATIQNKNRGQKIVFNATQLVESSYRPFCKENLYYSREMSNCVYQMPKLFPAGTEENLLICVPDVGGKKNFSALITNNITDLHFNGDAQCFPLYWYTTSTQGNLFGEEYERRDGVTDFILQTARQIYGGSVTKEDIFYYVYGFLHLPSYREKFSAELKKSLPRIFLVEDAKKFWQLVKAGRELAEIHLHYEKFSFAKDDRTTLIYNEHITIKNIPPRSFDYVVNGRSPLEWIIDRYQVKIDSASGIENNPNDWCDEHDNSRYILDLILSCITVSLKTLEIVENLPILEF